MAVAYALLQNTLLATAAVSGGKIWVNGERVKPAHGARATA
jgi:ribosomal 50S subunit-recycling heat shock protein